MEKYKNLIREILAKGVYAETRSGRVLQTFGLTFRHNLKEGLPILTTKKVNINACIHELLWLISGSTNVKDLHKNNVHIWDPWAKEDGDLGKTYGHQWRHSGPNNIDQVQYIIDEINTNPHSRRIILDVWNASDLKDMQLPPCVMTYQFYVNPASKGLSLSVYQRSADMFLGVPFDLVEASLFLCMVSAVTGYTPDELIFTFGNAHIYTNHFQQLKIQLERKCRELPDIELPVKNSIFDYTFTDFNIQGYNPHGFLKGEIAV